MRKKIYDKRDEQVLVECEFHTSKRCKETHNISVRAIEKNRGRNNGKYICFYCSRELKYSGRSNPNCRYIFDDGLFINIDNEYKAYILGFIAADGTVRKGTVSIFQNEPGDYILKDIRNFICKDMPIYKKENIRYISMCSKKMAGNICEHLGILPGKKSYTIGFPHHVPDDLKRHFIRGFLDGDGWIQTLRNKKTSPACGIDSCSQEFLKSIYEFIDTPGYIGKEVLEWHGNNALDVLGLLYENSNIYLKRKKELYEDWCAWVPSLSGSGGYGDLPLLKWNKTRKDAVPPSKKRVSDSGFDLVLLEKVHVVGNIEFYTTGIKIQPSYGWYFDLVPRSSITKTGYMLANNIGIIDRTYIGPILVPLVRVDTSAKPLELPCRLVQIVPRPIIHFKIEEVFELDNTERGTGGFGSSGVK